MFLIALTLCLSERVLIASEDVCGLSKRSRRETLSVAIFSVILAIEQSDAFHAASFYTVCTTITTGQMMTHATKFRARNVRGMVERGGWGGGGGGSEDGERLPQNETTVSRSLLGSLIILGSARTCRILCAARPTDQQGKGRKGCRG